jgi:predicted phosphate transport protein (TIGR00153 family)
MFRKFFPYEFNFYVEFDKQADCLIEGADCLKKAIEKGTVDYFYLRKVQEIEVKADESAAKIIAQLNKTFITPFDREDIYALTKALDDVIDMMNTISNRLTTYKITEVKRNLLEFSLVIEEAVRALSTAVKNMKDMKNYQSVMGSCVEVSRLENISDAIRDTALAALFDMEKDPILVIKWKELFEDAEMVVDICEDAAHVVESILLKQA